MGISSYAHPLCDAHSLLFSGHQFVYGARFFHKRQITGEKVAPPDTRAMRYDPRWGARPAKQRRKPASQRWEVRPRWSRQEATPAAETSDAVGTLIDPEWHAPRNQAEEARIKLLARARKLWGSPCSYADSLQQEANEEPDLWLATTILMRSQVSTYRAELQDCRLVERYDAKSNKLVRDTVAVLRRRKSQLDIPFSIDARTVSYFNQRVPTRVWREQQHGLRICVPGHPATHSWASQCIIP